MKVLIICQYFYPDITAAAFRITDVAELLTKWGNDVRVITAFAHKGEVSGDAAERLSLPEAHIYRNAMRPLGKGGFSTYIRHYLSFVQGSIASAWRLRRTGWRPDIIWASAPPLFTSISGYAAAKMFRKPWVLDVRDIWPESAVAAGQLRRGGLAFRVGKWMEAFSYLSAAHITCVSVPMERYITSRTRTQVTIVYNGVKLADIMDAAKPTFGGDRRRVLLYAGNLGRVQALDVLVRAIAELGRCGGMDGWEVRLVGNGAVRTELIALIKDLGLEGGVKVQPPVARSQIAQEVCQADALFLGLKSDPALRLTIPSKLFDCLAANKPVVAAITGEGAEIAGRSGGNVVCAPGETAALRKALEILFANFDDLAARALRNSNIIRESFTREKAVSVLADVLHRVHREGLDGH